jgi:hypothetical protein
MQFSQMTVLFIKRESNSFQINMNTEKILKTDKAKFQVYLFIVLNFM